jgi:hypothetical protein
MILGKREKILAGAVGALVLLVVGQLLYSSLFSEGRQSLGELRRQRNELRRRVEAHQQTVEQAKAALARLARWEEASLPRKPDAARSGYQAWLRGLVEKIGFRGADVLSLDQTRREAYTGYPFQVQGDASLDQIVRFLHEFYSAGHLHKIRRLSIVPIGSGERFNLAVSIEALALPGADREDTLTESNSDRLRLASLDEYRARINRRLMEGTRYVETGGLFASWQPPPKPPDPPRPPTPPPRPPTPPPTPPPPPAFDHSRYAVVTGILEVDGRPQLWLLAQTTGTRYELGEGEEFRIGGASGKVVRIGPREAEIDIGGRRRLLTVGQNLHEGLEVPE